MRRELENPPRRPWAAAGPGAHLGIDSVANRSPTWGAMAGNPKLLLRWAFVAAGLFLVRAGASPNIVFIVADDLGWADVAFHGGNAATPNLDRLAREGIELTQHYCRGHLHAHPRGADDGSILEPVRKSRAGEPPGPSLRYHHAAPRPAGCRLRDRVDRRPDKVDELARRMATIAQRDGDAVVR